MAKKINYVKLLNSYKDRLSIGFIVNRAGYSGNFLWSKRKYKSDLNEVETKRITDVIYKELWLKLAKDFGFLVRFRAEVAAEAVKKYEHQLAVEAIAARSKPAKTVSENSQEH